MSRYRPALEMQDPGLCGVRVFAPPTGAPHVAVGGGQVERCCSWTQTAQGFTDLVGHPSSGQRCLGEVRSRLGRHCARRHSPLPKRHWLRGRKPVDVGSVGNFAIYH